MNEFRVKFTGDDGKSNTMWAEGNSPEQAAVNAVLFWMEAARDSNNGEEMVGKIITTLKGLARIDAVPETN